MASTLSNQQIIDRMMQTTRQARSAPAAAAGREATSGVTLSNFAVTYPSSELIATVEVTAIPDGATLLGLTVAASPTTGSPTTYAMGVTADNAGLELPVSVLGASTVPTFPAASSVVGIVVATYSVGGQVQDAVITQPFLVGG